MVREPSRPVVASTDSKMEDRQTAAVERTNAAKISDQHLVRRFVNGTASLAVIDSKTADGKEAAMKRFGRGSFRHQLRFL